MVAISDNLRSHTENKISEPQDFQGLATTATSPHQLYCISGHGILPPSLPPSHKKEPCSPYFMPQPGGAECLLTKEIYFVSLHLVSLPQRKILGILLFEIQHKARTRLSSSLCNTNHVLWYFFSADKYGLWMQNKSIILPVYYQPCPFTRFLRK